MGVNLDISEKLQSYISNFSLKLNPVQLEIINYNKTLGDIKRMQIDPTQCHFLHLIIKISNIKNVLEIGTGLGVSTRAISTTAFKVTSIDIDPWAHSFRFPGNVSLLKSIPSNHFEQD